MAPEIQQVPDFPKREGAVRHWRQFCEQWRHSYLLLTAMFLVVWRVAALPIPKLEHTRIAGGLHPLDVLLLMNLLKHLWVFPLVCVVLYAASFLAPKLNTPGAIAVSALSSTALLALVVLFALIYISLWSL